MRRLLVTLVAVTVACSPATDPTTTPPPSSGTCTQPPASEVDATSVLDIRVEPAPTTPLGEALLVVASEGLPEGALAGVDAGWQCWDGAQWVTTHIVYRGFGSNPGQTIPVNQEFQIRVPSIGLGLDQGYPIVIPPVDPGTYRIEDEIIVDDGTVPGFVIVEVVAG